MDNRVVVLDCDSYEVGQLKKVLQEGLNALQLDPHLFFGGKKVVLKPNLLLPKKPENGVTTHPNLMQALAEIVRENKARETVIGDTPGGPFNRPYLKALYLATGMEKAGQAAGVSLNYNLNEVDTPFPQGRVMKRINIAAFIHEADLLINVAKLKTHGLTRITGGVKNLFGAVPGVKKAEFHMNMSEVNDFAMLMVDLARLLQPALTIIDGVQAMEGNGPSSGTLKGLGKIIMAPNVFAADVAMARIMGLNPGEVPTIKMAEKVDCLARLADLDVVGELGEEKFEVPGGKREIKRLRNLIPKSWLPRFQTMVQPTPRFNWDLCTGCGMCAQHCPPAVISGAPEKRPVIDLEGCIRCFCCQELCPEKAVTLYRPLLGRIIFR